MSPDIRARPLGVTGPSAPAGARRPAAGFRLLAIVQITAIATITMVTVALPRIGTDLRLESPDLVLVAAAYSLPFGGLLLVGGAIADRWGPRRVMTAGLVLAALASALGALSTGLATLLAARYVQGAGAALAVPSAMALISAVYPDPGRKARATALWGVFAGVGAALGTTVAGIVLIWASWRWLFLPPTLAALTVAAFAPRLVPERRPAGRTRVGVTGGLLATIGVTSLTCGLSMSALPPSLTGLAVLGVFGYTQHRSSAPLLPLRFAPEPRRLAALAAIVVTSGVMASAYFLLALGFTQVRDYTPLQVSLAFLSLVLAGLAAGPLAARLAATTSPRTVLLVGLASAGTGLGLISRMGPYSGPLLAGLLLFPLGTGMVFSAATTVVAADVREEEVGMVGGLINTVMEIGPPLGLALWAPLAHTHGYGMAFACGCLTVLLALLVTACARC